MLHSPGTTGSETKEISDEKVREGVGRGGDKGEKSVVCLVSTIPRSVLMKPAMFPLTFLLMSWLFNVNLLVRVMMTLTLVMSFRAVRCSGMIVFSGIVNYRMETILVRTIRNDSDVTTWFLDAVFARYAASCITNKTQTFL